MNEIIPANLKIDLASLSQEHYFQSFLKEAYLNNLLTDKTSTAIQIQLSQILGQQIESYTQSKSSSLPIEIADSLFSSILYLIGLYFKTIKTPENAIDILKSTPIPQLFSEGFALERPKILTAKLLFKQLLKNQIKTENIAYQSTINTGLSPFFKAYRPKYFAHETPGLSIDYPLLIAISDLAGIEYFTTYLHRLNLENQFCQAFADDKIHLLLSSYDENYHDLIINISYLVLKNALGCCLLDQPCQKLLLIPATKKQLEKLLIKQSPNLYSILEQSLIQIAKDCHLSHSCLKYFKKRLFSLGEELSIALENQTIEQFFIFYTNKPENRLFYFQTPPMLPSDYYNFITELKSCRYFEDQLAMIQSNIHSLSDLIAIFENISFPQKIVNQIFDLLPDQDLAALYQQYILPLKKGYDSFTAQEESFLEFLQAYLYVQSDERLQALKNLACRLIIKVD